MWKVSSLNPKYEVNEYGQVRNIRTKNVLKGYKDKNGYIIYDLIDDCGNRKSRKGHILVAYEFCDGRTSEKCYVNHIDFNKTNNSASNLEWVTHKENMEHWRKSQPFYTEINIPIIERENKINKGKCPVCQYDLQGNLLNIFESYMAAERATGAPSGNISACCRGKRRTVKGFIWRDLIEGSETIESIGENRINE